MNIWTTCLLCWNMLWIWWAGVKFCWNGCYGDNNVIYSSVLSWIMHYISSTCYDIIASYCGVVCDGGFSFPNAINTTRSWDIKVKMYDGCSFTKSCIFIMLNITDTSSVMKHFHLNVQALPVVKDPHWVNLKGKHLYSQSHVSS